MASIRERRMSSMGWTGTRSIDCPQEDGHVCRHWKAAPEGPLNELLPDHNYVENPHSNAPKNRLDHRHHAIDAAVVGATDRRLLNEISKAAGRAEDQNLDKLFDGLPTPWEGFRDELRESLARVIISHKADHGRKGVATKGMDEIGRAHV